MEWINMEQPIEVIWTDELAEKFYNSTMSAEPRGDDKKYDGGKLMWDLFHLDDAEKIVEVLTYGAKKYGKPSGWETVPDAKARYFAALMRHLKAYQSGEKIDPESGLSHLSHAGCNIMFLLHFENQEG